MLPGQKVCGLYVKFPYFTKLVNPYFKNYRSKEDNGLHILILPIDTTAMWWGASGTKGVNERKKLSLYKGNKTLENLLHVT